MLYKLLKALGLIETIVPTGRNFVHYQRIVPVSDILEETDFLYGGFAQDTSFYNIVRQKRKNLFPELVQREDFKEEWETREGESITREKFHTRHHELHDIELYDKVNDEIYVVDAVYKQHHHGSFISLLVRKKGTRSHGVRPWININCHDPIFLEAIEENKIQYSVINKKENISSG